ncbi:TetR/AcrR family transcriptional regulator [Frankia sp. QA3]|uniref:TetR/AcrR family transcriptional regulator n=1 Tax=Frankia sp. QA3 TaxID=710111 RepID=UPI000269C48D|nr:TetR/AcrR family transcriptional regulator [Frankia sp. QA3]EIV94334.1 transcriptional regulator [Frankia sp. QA3]
MSQVTGRANKRDAVLRESARLFAERGIEATTMRAIADACGMQAASLYHHFASKDELVAAILTRSDAHISGLYDAILDAPLEPADRLEAMIRATLDNFGHHRDAARIYYRDRAYVAESPLLTQVRDNAVAHDELWDRSIEAAIAAGRISPRFEAINLRRLLQELMWSTARLRGDAVSADDIVHVLLHGILAPEPGRGEPSHRPEL